MKQRMFDSLFSPIQIGPVTLRNRIVMAPLETNLATTQGEINDAVLAFYGERAKSGPGLILTEGAYVHIAGRARLNQFSIANDRLVPGMKKLVDIVHSHGSKIAAQLAHAGRQTSFSASGQQPLAPSPVPCSCIVCHEVPRELTSAEIAQLIGLFGEAARRAKQAGFDAVEIHGAHGYLIHSFFSPHTNKRQDEYGGNIEARMRLPLEVLERVRESVGPNFPILYRMSAVEFLEDGVQIDQAQVLARALEQRGIDALDVSAGIYESGGICPYMDYPRGHLTQYAGQIKEVARIPVITVGGINDPALADEALQQGLADLVAFGRAFFADPQWPSKASAGQYDEITRCLRCNVCLERLFVQESVVCVVNPALGNERHYRIERSAKRKTVLIIGGGLAGMAAARTCALRGHKAVLYEKDCELGGQALLASKIKHKREFALSVDSLEKQVRRADVDLRLGCNVDMSTVDEMQPDIVILATGATAEVPNVPGTDLLQSVTTFDILREREHVGNRVFVAGAGLIGAETAIFLAEKGKTVTISSWGGTEDIAKGATSSAQYSILSDFSKYGVNVATNASLKEVSAGRVILHDLDPRTRTNIGSETIVENVDTVVFAYDLVPARELYSPLREAGYLVHTIGDCVSPRSALDAIHEGYQVALRI